MPKQPLTNAPNSGQSKPPDPTPIIELIEAFRRSKAMFAAVALGVFDRLEGGPASAHTLAEELRLDCSALERLLHGCVGMGLLRMRRGVFENSDLAKTYLTRSSPQTLSGYVLYSNSALYPMWAHLEDAVREGTPRWSQTFGLDGTLFSHFFRTEEAMRDFLSGMHGFGLISSESVVEAFDLGRFRRLADLGGATGHLALAACRRYPELQAAVFDLEPVIRYAREYTALSPLAERIQLIAGDFDRDTLPAADIYALGRILHDWGEDRIRFLLKKIYDALPAGGGLLIAEKLLDEDKTGPLSAQMQSLNMLICTEGRERTLQEYAALLTAAGFGTVEGRRTGKPLDAVLALKN